MSAALTVPQYHVEFIDGQEVEKHLPKKLHVFVQQHLIVELTRMLPPRYGAAPELNVLTGRLTREGRREYIVPDVTVVAEGMRYEDGDLAEAPVWGVEILSPVQTLDDLFVRAGRLLKLGAPLAWVIWPEKRRAWEYTREDLREKHDALTAELPESEEIRVSLAETWAAMAPF